MIKQLLTILTLGILTGLPAASFAQAPVMGTVSDYVLFSSNGAVTNSGLSHLTGNVGTNSGACTGFGNVNGVMHTSDGSTLTCAADLLSLYTQLNNAIPTFSPASNLIGNGDTLEAGVIALSGTASLNDTLFLDAENDANAVFIFKIQGAFSTNSLSQVVLINGAQACNIFWKVEGLVSIAGGTSMSGNIVANNAAIDVNTNATVHGRVLSTTGAVSVHGILAYTPIGCGSPHHYGPAAPALGTTACYGLFSTNGSVTNAGITTVKGDIGTNVGLTTGYNPLLVDGMIHPIPDASTNSCAADLLTVYNYLNTLPYDIELLYPAQFGNSLVLTPHTYLLNAATTLTDILILNAEGDSNAVFVMLINGALSTSTFAEVQLINGAKAKNVFWKIQGALNVSDYSEFKGTFVVSNGAISLSTGVELEGRAMSINGALSTSAVNVGITAGCIILPVTWLYFNGVHQDGGVKLTWGTTDEMNNGHFTIEKSENGNDFTRLANINAATSGDAGERNYSFMDANPKSRNFYRISQTDVSGHTSIFKTISVDISKKTAFDYYLDGNTIKVRTTGGLQGQGNIAIYTMDGRKVSSLAIPLNEAATYSMEKPQVPGIYIIRLESKDEHLMVGKIEIN